MESIGIEYLIRKFGGPAAGGAWLEKRVTKKGAGCEEFHLFIECIDIPTHLKNFGSSTNGLSKTPSLQRQGDG